MTIGKRIKECRVKKGLTQEQLAELMYVTPVQISHYENDKNDIKVSVLKELAMHLGVSTTYLVDGATEYFCEDAMRIAMILQGMKSKELRRAAIEQVKILAGIDATKSSANREELKDFV